jgi:hypothetical protein
MRRREIMAVMLHQPQRFRPIGIANQIRSSGWKAVTTELDSAAQHFQAIWGRTKRQTLCWKALNTLIDAHWQPPQDLQKHFTLGWITVISHDYDSGAICSAPSHPRSFLVWYCYVRFFPSHLMSVNLLDLDLDLYQISITTDLSPMQSSIRGGMINRGPPK